MEKIEALLTKTTQDLVMTSQKNMDKTYLAGKVTGIVAVIKIMGEIE